MSGARSWMCLFVWLAAGAVTGCGSGEVPSVSEGVPAANSKPEGLPRAAIAAPGARPAPKKTPAKASPNVDADDDDPTEVDDDEKDDAVEFVMPKEGTPEWLVHAATKLLLEAPPKTENVEVLKKHRHDRNERIIELSKEALAQTHGDREKERIFNVAVHNLLEARLQEALTGERGRIDLLYEDAAALSKRDSQSKAAAEGRHALVQLAYGMARNSTGDSPLWLEEFARQARLFAQSFPNEERRSLPLLFTAGRSCELADLPDDALECYVLIQKTFPKSAFAARVGPIVRRLKLPGKPPQLAGPTIDGDRVQVDDLLGKVVLVVFWSTEAKPFREQLPKILEISRKQSRRGLSVVGVNLDEDASLVEQFVVKYRIPWPQIFYPEREKRGWNNPIVQHYGIMDVPALWLIDQSGNVVGTSMKIDRLAADIDKLLQGASPKSDATAGK